ncbi:hypothetical protein Gmet_3137 [Geobacter metallireducens GS-15]|uniref:Uncharacterized protein n=1 Tax=Geobacter metallireducens (strain ATCC 53774 / DSM 7210 / GS-15) TaxID=269799 RepID=Q39QX4_GEOMG|nr:hypothetical protein Gmet_3137 [Geobacter metallireducens GS-15]
MGKFTLYSLTWYWTMQRASVKLGIFVTMREPTRGILGTVQCYGYYDYQLSENLPVQRIPSIHVLSEEQFFRGKYPHELLLPHRGTVGNTRRAIT